MDNKTANGELFSANWVHSYNNASLNARKVLHSKAAVEDVTLMNLRQSILLGHLVGLIACRKLVRT